MNQNKKYSSWREAQKVLGDDFWDIMSEVLPNIGPRIDMYRGKKELIIAVELPGLEGPDDISMVIQGNFLLLEGSIERPYVTTHEGFLQDERFHGPFRRKLKIPTYCLLDELSANYSKGILYIRIPHDGTRSETKNEKIKINFNN